MATVLVIAGHGENENNTFDSGATGFIAKGEHRYYEEDFFPAMRKFIPEGADIVLFSDYNVYNHENIVSLANSYGSDTIVVEMHYDASDAESASRGHIIIHADYEPDSLDLKLRDAIEKHIGIRYTHKGNEGISGRDNLYNCNVTASNNVNYRMVELGFGTSKKDATTMVQNVEAIAKDFVEILLGDVKDVATTVKDVSVDKAQPLDISGLTIDELAHEVIQGEFGNGEERKSILGGKYDAVQDRVAELLGSNLSEQESPVGTVGLPVSGTYSKGTHGNTYSEEVLAIQLALSAVYFYPDKGAKNHGADGYFGDKTVDAVERFQSVYTPNMVDGIVGKATLDALAKQAGSTVSTGVKVADGRKFKLPTSGVYSKAKNGGKYSADVLVIQNALCSVYFYPEKGAKNHGADGYFGDNTEDAVTRFQTIYTPNDVDGIVGKATLEALDKQAN